MSLLLSKIREVTVSVLPITVLVLILHFTLTPLESDVLAKFLGGTLFMLIGIPVFLLGVDLSVEPIGEHMSEALVKTNKLWVILLGGGFLGFIVTISEPDLHILADQVRAITQGQFNADLMVILVSLGVGVLVSFAILRIIKNIRLNIFMTLIYGLIFVLAIFTSSDFLAISFDASGNTTGSVSVPFVLALGVSISSLTRSNEIEENDGFGMLGIASAGAILAVLLQGIFTSASSFEGSLPEAIPSDDGVLRIFAQNAVDNMGETLVVIAPILIIFLLMNFFWMKLPRERLIRIFVGLGYTYIGLVLFLTGINTGFLEASRVVGFQIAAYENPWLVVLIGMVFGVVTIPAEPSVHVLTKQIEDNTAGSIKSLTVMITLCAGMAVAIALSMLRILIPGLALWHILLPGMLIGIVLSYFVPDIFVGIAFDSGGVAAGTMTSVFILPFAQGIAGYQPGANIVEDAFGIIALVAMTPLIAIQVLGLIYQLKAKRAAKIELSEDTAEDMIHE